MQRRSLCLRTGRVRRGCAAFCINARAGKKRGENPYRYCIRRGQRYCKCNRWFYRVLIYYYQTTASPNTTGGQRHDRQESLSEDGLRAVPAQCPRGRKGQRLHYQFIPSGDQQLPCKVYHCRQMAKPAESAGRFQLVFCGFRQRPGAETPRPAFGRVMEPRRSGGSGPAPWGTPPNSPHTRSRS